MSYVTCHVMCHMSHGFSHFSFFMSQVTFHYFLFFIFFFTNLCIYSVEGLFLTGPTLSSFLAALSSSRSLVVGPSVRWSVRPLVGPSVIFVKKWSLEYQKVIITHLRAYLLDSSYIRDSSDSSESVTVVTIVTVVTVVTVMTVLTVVTKQLCTQKIKPT